MANNATQLAKSKIRSMCCLCISKSMRINDALIPLTTNHHRGAILKDELLHECIPEIIVNQLVGLLNVDIPF